MQFHYHRRLAMASAILIGLGFSIGTQAAAPRAMPNASAHQAGSIAARDRMMQVRIRNGLRTGQLNAHEAAYLERGASRIERQQARDLSDGRLTRPEEHQLNRELDRENARIANQKSDAQIGHPGSRNSQFMEADVQRSINQEQRIHAGVHDGDMTQAEVGRLQARESNIDRLESRAGSDGFISGNEQMRINRNDNQDARAVRHHERDKAKNPDAEQNDGSNK